MQEYQSPPENKTVHLIFIYLNFVIWMNSGVGNWITLKLINIYQPSNIYNHEGKNNNIHRKGSTEEDEEIKRGGIWNWLPLTITWLLASPLIELNSIINYVTESLCRLIPIFMSRWLLPLNLSCEFLMNSDSRDLNLNSFTKVISKSIS